MENLRKLRKKMQFSQKEIAEKLNITQSAYSQYETGKTEPDIDTIIKLANILRCSTDELLGRKWETL